MTDDKKSEWRWEESERLGPYQLHEQVQHSAHSRGGLYRATHETSGAAALVLKPTSADEDGSLPLSDWRVRCISSGAPSYLALEVEHSPWTFAPGKHSSEELVCMFEDLHDGVRRMARLVPTSDEPRPRWRLGLALAGAATLTLALALLLATQAPVTEVQVQVQEATVEAWATDVNVDAAPVRTGEAPRPVRNQKRAPCTAGLEVEVSGACWLPIEKRPCPPQTVAYEGKCLLPVAVPRPPGTSLDGGDVPEPR
ncbi:hypothetical protein [Archangium sp.]|uniref:hypothetical protein n=1 Tax=Archangium sp. TaxID=1872627 RepID=UPI002D347638|nr:hypothetical protein [Archangium sp.]HYO51848.1 hypothetical protein [Archangium sp.]